MAASTVRAAKKVSPRPDTPASVWTSTQQLFGNSSRRRVSIRVIFTGSASLAVSCDLLGCSRPAHLRPGDKGPVCDLILCRATRLIRPQHVEQRADVAVA